MSKTAKKWVFYISVAVAQILLLIIFGNLIPDNTWARLLVTTPLFLTVFMILLISAKSIHKRHELAGYFLYFLVFAWGVITLINIIVNLAVA